MNPEAKPRENASAGEALESELKELREKADEYLDLAKRIKADFINYQDRVRREREEWRQEAVSDFLRDFIPALDSFMWARFEQPTLMESLRLIEKEFFRSLSKHSVVPIETSGKAFDPRYHEAVSTVETTAKPEGTILEEVRRGWMSGDRVLRPASVVVAKAPPSPKPDKPDINGEREPEEAESEREPDEI